MLCVVMIVMRALVVALRGFKRRLVSGVALLRRSVFWVCFMVTRFD